MLNPEKLDLVGVSCPMNFVKIKMALDRLPAGAVLEVLLGGAEIALEVEGSLVGQGYEVIKRRTVENKVVIQVCRSA